MFLFPADQHFFTGIRMYMTGLHHDCSGREAFLGMLMPQNFHMAADHMSVFVKAFLGVHMLPRTVQKHCPAGIIMHMPFGFFQFTGEIPYAWIAFLGMNMALTFLHAALQNFCKTCVGMLMVQFAYEHIRIAVLAVYMTVRFFQPAHRILIQKILSCIALIRMNMPRIFLLSAHKYPGIALICVFVFRKLVQPADQPPFPVFVLHIAEIIMNMNIFFRISADQGAIFIPAVLCVYMRLKRTVQIQFRSGFLNGFLVIISIACFRMHMLLHLACLDFHSNGRFFQRLKHRNGNHDAEKRRNPAPGMPELSLAQVFIGFTVTVTLTVPFPRNQISILHLFLISSVLVLMHFSCSLQLEIIRFLATISK